MSKKLQLEILNKWVNFNAMTDKIINELETALKEQNNISLKEFYVMYYLSQEN
ncbi:hypothetical protein ACEQPO_15115 [Bacillus sp. SL00103]